MIPITLYLYMYLFCLIYFIKKIAKVSVALTDISSRYNETLQNRDLFAELNGAYKLLKSSHVSLLVDELTAGDIKDEYEKLDKIFLDFEVSINHVLSLINSTAFLKLKKKKKKIQFF